MNALVGWKAAEPVQPRSRTQQGSVAAGPGACSDDKDAGAIVAGATAELAAPPSDPSVSVSAGLCFGITEVVRAIALAAAMLDACRASGQQAA